MGLMRSTALDAVMELSSLSLRRIMGRVRRRSWQPPVDAVVSAVVLVVLATAAVTASTPARSAGGSGGLTRLLPPPDGQAYFGFTFRIWETSDPAWGDARAFSDRIRDSIQFELAGKTPTFLTVWAPWQYPDQSGKPLVPFSNSSGDVSKVQGITGAHSLLYLDWNIASTTAQNGGITTKDIASSALDGYIRAYARELKSFGDPVLIRLFGGEFNGSWWFGQSPRANPNLTPADFVAAWRRAVDIFRQVGALNVSFAWIPNTFPPTPVDWVDPDIAVYYPGDTYVDWVGADTYDVGPSSWLDPIYAFATTHAKPFFLAEWGVRHDGSGLTPPEEQSWLGAMFDYFESHPDIKAINYFNYNSRPNFGIPWDPSRAVYLYGGQVNYLANVNDNDNRLLAESGADFRGTFSRRIANAHYVSSILTQHFAPPVKCLVPNVKNKPLAVAKRAILARHCRVGKIRRAYSKRVKKHRLISEKPKPGTVLPGGGKVNLVVSRGRKH
jgi:Glycosyl hydrolase family 26/PASTA domain